MYMDRKNSSIMPFINTTLKQGTANENAANVGSSKRSDQRENDK